MLERQRASIQAQFTFSYSEREQYISYMSRQITASAECRRIGINYSLIIPGFGRAATISVKRGMKRCCLVHSSER
jgi:hypothetical protein